MQGTYIYIFNNFCKECLFFPPDYVKLSFLKVSIFVDKPSLQSHEDEWPFFFYTFWMRQSLPLT